MGSHSAKFYKADFSAEPKAATREIACAIGESAPIYGETSKLLLAPDGDNNVSAEEVTGAHNVVQRYLSALCNGLLRRPWDLVGMCTLAKP